MLPPIKKLLYASDLGENARQVFAYAATLARQFSAEIVFVHAIEPLGPTARTLVRNMVPQAQFEELEKKGLESVRSEIRKRIDEFCKTELRPQTGGNEIVADIRILEGHPAYVILDQAAAVGADLIVIGSHGRSRLQRSLIGSVARSVTAGADRPVLIVPIADDVQ